LGKTSSEQDTSFIRAKIQSGVLRTDVQKAMDNHLVPIIECQTLSKAVEIYDKDPNTVIIFVQPKSIDELTKRIIRSRPGTETEETLNYKMNVAQSEMNKALGLSCINKIFTNEETDDFVNQASAHLIHNVYKAI
jgi:guanylate kinase